MIANDRRVRAVITGSGVPVAMIADVGIARTVVATCRTFVPVISDDCVFRSLMARLTRLGRVGAADENAALIDARHAASALPEQTIVVAGFSRARFVLRARAQRTLTASARTLPALGVVVEAAHPRTFAPTIRDGAAERPALEWGHSGISVHFLVVEEGVYSEEIHGIRMEAAKFLSTVTDNSGSWVGEIRTYAQSDSQPVVMGQVMSTNDGFSSFWSGGSGSDEPA